MAVASPRAPSAPTRPTSISTNHTTEVELEWWVNPVKWVALVVFIAVPIFSLFAQAFAGRVVWTMVVAGLPLFIVLVGYHRWRRICPLAFFAQIPVRLRRPGTRKASPWLEKNYNFVAFTIFFASLWLRLIATNGDGPMLSAFFVLLSLAALAFGALYTGKTWCNHICPVSFIEKIYTEPHGLRETSNSQCTKCSACKKFCPDINEENSYWKEIQTAPKRFIYFAFPGLVFGFYFYYYLQSGTWDYYFGGSWTNQPGVIRTAFLPGRDPATAGFFFLPLVPRALASSLTLAVFALLSFLLFTQIEKLIGNWLRQRDAEADQTRVRHITYTIAAFIAFITFYSFAGAPTLWRLPWVFPQLFLIAVVLTATLFLMRRLRRTQKSFAEETLARNIIRRWEWTDTEPPKDLREAFLIHKIRTRESARGRAQVLGIYKDAVRETLANGFVTREEVQLLESLRNQMQIKNADHEKVMAALAEEERAAVSKPTKQISAEKRLQLETYAHALENYLKRVFATSGAIDDSFIVQLRAEYRVTKEEHAAVLDKLLGGTQGMAAQLAEEINAAERAAQTITALDAEAAMTPALEFLRDLLQRRQRRAIDRLMHGLSFAPDDDTSLSMRRNLASPDRELRKAAMEQLRGSVTQSVGERLLSAYHDTITKESAHAGLSEILRARTESLDPYIRAVALYALGERRAADQEILNRLERDEHEIVRETALRLKQNERHDASAMNAVNKSDLLISVEKMIALRSAPIFSRLAPTELAELARSCREDKFGPGEALCVEGERGNEVFILLAGDVQILRRDGASARVVGVEKAGGLIGEMAVLDPAPRAATVVAGENGVRALRLDGDAFRDALNTDPAIASSMIRTLARRLRN